MAVYLFLVRIINWKNKKVFSHILKSINYVLHGSVDTISHKNEMNHLPFFCWIWFLWTWKCLSFFSMLFSVPVIQFIIWNVQKAVWNTKWQKSKMWTEKEVKVVTSRDFDRFQALQSGNTFLSIFLFALLSDDAFFIPTWKDVGCKGSFSRDFDSCHGKGRLLWYEDFLVRKHRKTFEEGKGRMDVLLTWHFMF